MVRPSFSIVIPLHLVVTKSNSVIETASSQAQITMAQEQQATRVT
jgi:hypothetical protein